MKRSLHNNINLIVESIEKQARKEQQLLEVQWRELYAAKSSALEKEIKDKYQMQTNFAISKMNKETNRTLSNLEAAYKSEISKLRQSVTDDVFAKAYENLQKFPQTESYAGFLESSAGKLSLLYSESAVIYIRPEDEKYIPNIKKAFGQAVSFEQDNSIKLGGIKVYFKNAGVIADDTLDSRLEEQKKTFIKNCGLGFSK